MNMKNEAQTDANNFLRLGKRLATDVTEGKLPVLEFLLLVWLQIHANPINGTCKTSYSSLVDDLRGLLSKNCINKLMLNLKRKRYIWFPRQMGRRGSFLVEIDRYPLSNREFLDISHHFGGRNGRSAEQPTDRSQAEITTNRQKLENARKDLSKGLMIDSDSHPGRSPNNKNNNENNSIDNNFSSKRIDPESFNPNSHEESRCREIAKSLGECDVRFLLSALKKYGLGIIEEAWGNYREADTTGVKNRGAYFNQIVQKLVSEKAAAKGFN